MPRPPTKTALSAVADLRNDEKRSLALRLLQETDPNVLDAVKLAEQEKDMQAKLDMAQHDEEKRQRNEPHFWIEINRMGQDDTETFVFVGAAGVSYHIQKDVAVPVPKSVLEVLDNAVMVGNVKIADEARGVSYIKKMKFKRYPYSRLGPASKEEVEAFRAEQDRRRKAADDETIGQEMARAQLVDESVASQEEAFVPAFMRPTESREV